MPTPAEQTFITNATNYCATIASELPLGNNGRRSGFSVLAARNGVELIADGYNDRDLDNGSNFSADTITAIRSLTKEMTAACILEILEEDLANNVYAGYASNIEQALNLPVVNQTFFPTVYDSYDAQSATTMFDPSITIRNILAHTSGFALPWGHRPWGYNDFASEGALLDLAFKEGIQFFAPNAKTNYSDLIGWILGAIIKDRRQMTWGQYLQTHFTNAGMTRSFPTLGGNWTPAQGGPGTAPSLYGRTASTVVANTAKGYTYCGEGWWPDIEPGYKPEIYNSPDVGSCIGSVYSTARDMHKWYAYLRAGQVCSIASYNAMNVAQTNQPNASSSTSDVNKANYGIGSLNFGFGTTIGESIGGHAIVQNNGAYGGPAACSIHFPNHNGYIIVLVNMNYIAVSGANEKHKYAHGMARTIAEMYVAQGLVS